MSDQTSAVTQTPEEIMREGEGIMESTHIPTASANESQSLADIDRQIAALQEERRLAALRTYPTFEEFARLPWIDSGAGVIRSASRACVLLTCDSDLAPDDWAEKNAGRERLVRMVLTAVNSHHDLIAALKAVQLYMRDDDEAFSREVDPEWADLIHTVTIAIAKVEQG